MNYKLHKAKNYLHVCLKSSQVYKLVITNTKLLFSLEHTNIIIKIISKLRDFYLFYNEKCMYYKNNSTPH